MVEADGEAPLLAPAFPFILDTIVIQDLVSYSGFDFPTQQGPGEEISCLHIAALGIFITPVVEVPLVIDVLQLAGKGTHGAPIVPPGEIYANKPGIEPCVVNRGGDILYPLLKASIYAQCKMTLPADAGIVLLSLDKPRPVRHAEWGYLYSPHVGVAPAPLLYGIGVAVEILNGAEIVRAVGIRNII